MVTLICPVVAHTSLSALCRYHIPQEKLGMHIGYIISLMTVPSVILAVPASWYIDLHTAESDSGFYGAFLHIFLAMTLFILAAAWFILRLNPRKESAPRRRRPGFTDIAEPFRNRPYRVFLHASFMLSMVGTMITALHQSLPSGSSEPEQVPGQPDHGIGLDAGSWLEAPLGPHVR